MSDQPVEPLTEGPFLTDEERLTFIRSCVRSNPGGFTDDFKFLLATLDAAAPPPDHLTAAEIAELEERTEGWNEVFRQRVLDAAHDRPGLDVCPIDGTPVTIKACNNGHSWSAEAQQREGAGEEDRT